MLRIYPSYRTVIGNKEVMTSYTGSFGGLANTIVFEGDKVLFVEQTHGTYEGGKKTHEEIFNSLGLENLANSSP